LIEYSLFLGTVWAQAVEDMRQLAVLKGAEDMQSPARPIPSFANVLEIKSAEAISIVYTPFLWCSRNRLFWSGPFGAVNKKLL